jgi:hypothetical protein
MIRVSAVLLAASLQIGLQDPAACASAQAAAPFEPLPVVAPEPASHGRAYATLLAGAGLVGLSFPLTDRANHAYSDYLAATDPAEVVRLYDRAVRFDRLSAAALLTGEAFFVAGVYLRFLSRPSVSRISVVLDMRRCAVSVRF